MSETTKKLRAFQTYSVGAGGVRDLAADAIEAVEAQVAEAVARVAAERDEAQGASILNANAVRLQKARAEAAEKELAEARAISAATAERVLSETQIATELRKDLDDAKREASVWKRECEMFSKAWSRELGPRRPKSHLIDELVVGTKDLVAERDALRAELVALRAKPRFRTRKVTKADVEEFIAHDGSFYESLRALGFRRRVEQSK